MISKNLFPTKFIYFLECSETLTARNLLLNNVQSMQDLFTKVSTNDILQFLQECDFYNKIYRYLHFYIFLIFLSPSDGT